MIGRNQAGGEVAAAQILFQGDRHLDCDLLGRDFHSEDFQQFDLEHQSCIGRDHPAGAGRPVGEELAPEVHRDRLRTAAHRHGARGLAALEGELAMGEQKLADLAKELDEEKMSKEMLNSELSMKTAQVAELRQKLEATLSSRAELENDIEKSKNEIAELEGQLLDLKAQKTSSDTQLGQLKSRNEALAAELEELKGAKERVAALEGELAMRDQALSQSKSEDRRVRKECKSQKEAQH